MATLQAPRQHLPQGFVSTYSPRLRTYRNSLLGPVFPQANTVVPSRTTKRGTTAINYAEDGYDDDFDVDSSEGPRRFTGLRSLRRDDSGSIQTLAHHQDKIGKEINAPVEVQGIWREWMGKPKRVLSHRQCETQAELPVTLVPVRIDLDIQPFRPEPPLPTPQNTRDYGIDESLPAYRYPDVTPQYRLKDTFLWNLHEALITPDQFAKTLVDELDFPTEKKSAMIAQIATQIRTQLEEYAGVALHPLFHATGTVGTGNDKALVVQQTVTGTNTPAAIGTPLPHTSSHVNGANGTIMNGTNGTSGTVNTPSEHPPTIISATATAEPSDIDDALNPDDTYRCIVSLNVNIMNKLYSDKFEWSLLHPPGYAEHFAKQTCADLGLAAEWVPAIAHAIHESVLKIKKEACENGGLLGYSELDNDAAEGVEAGWRYEPETLGDDWSARVETLSKEEMERREFDRERQVRRQRRETARFTSTTGVVGGVPQSDYFANPVEADQPMGRGERSKRKRRFRSLSPNGGNTPEESGYGGGPSLTEMERMSFRCTHCLIPGSAVWAVRDGPKAKRSLCQNCGYLYERDGKLPPWSYKIFEGASAR